MTYSSDLVALLPRALQDASDHDSGEPAWRQDDVVTVMQAAQRLSLANLGGEVQFRFPDKVCELYWLCYGPKIDRQPNESWEDCVLRTANDSISQFQRLIQTVDLVKRPHLFSFIT